MSKYHELVEREWKGLEWPPMTELVDSREKKTKNDDDRNDDCCCCATTEPSTTPPRTEQENKKAEDGDHIVDVERLALPR